MLTFVLYYCLAGIITATISYRRTLEELFKEQYDIIKRKHWNTISLDGKANKHLTEAEKHLAILLETKDAVYEQSILYGWTILVAFFWPIAVLVWTIGILYRYVLKPLINLIIPASSFEKRIKKFEAEVDREREAKKVAKAIQEFDLPQVDI